MTRFSSASLAVVPLLMVACVRQPPKVASVPPPPQPAPPPAPLVFPQNVAKAPPSQPVPPDAVPSLAYGGLAITPEPESPPARPVNARAAASPAAVRTEAPAPSPAEVPATTGTAARAPAALQSRNDRARNRAAVEAQIRQTQAALVKLKARTLTGGLKDDRDRAASLLELAQRAIARGDLRQADDLSGRAAILAKTLLDAN